MKNTDNQTAAARQARQSTENPAVGAFLDHLALLIARKHLHARPGEKIPAKKVRKAGIGIDGGQTAR